MELHQLRYLVALAEDLSFTRAAARANVAQPALSRQIRKLEEELAVPLVDRTTRRVALTPAGRDVVDRARRILEEVDDLHASTRGAVALVSGRLSIGMTPTPGPFDVAGALAAFHAQHPGVELAMTEELSIALADRLRRDELDVAFVSAIPERARSGLELVPLTREPLQIVVGTDHRLAGRRSAPLAVLENERFVAFPPGATIRETIAQAARDAGFAPRIAFESNETGRIRALVAQGLGVAVLPTSDATRPGPDVAAIDISGRRLAYEVLLAWRRERRLSPAAVAFTRAVRA